MAARVSVPSAGLEVLQCHFVTPLVIVFDSFSTLCGFGSPSITQLERAETAIEQFQYPLRVWKSFNLYRAFIR